MRIAALIAASVLVAGCSHTVAGEQSTPSLTVPPSTTHAAPSTTSPTSTTAAKAPGAGAPMRDVIAWVEAGGAADATQFHSATRDGATTDLGDDVAFVTPSGKTNCMTDAKYSQGALACLVDLTNPPPRPDDAYGQWKGGWVDYDGMSVQIGSVHGDPGRFTAGSGPELPYGQSLAFGDYRCRSDQAGLVCVNYAHQSAARFSDAGVQVFGCLQPATAPPQIGQMFSC
ncbi:hypothetical protein GGC64_002660 [Mycobacterium sp. OAS707]|uniref:hypothetical protein n=1 Tax=Mycobacterium sp. OAS707 TaxID=2663822 RepID=UPI0017895759|nr:hypothetical protein [Mycobacterium sp. OAS707]MBE1548636.1 hypothetical protein [Mycobacterium sp. OAS707]